MFTVSSEIDPTLFYLGGKILLCTCANWACHRRWLYTPSSLGPNIWCLCGKSLSPKYLLWSYYLISFFFFFVVVGGGGGPKGQAFIGQVGKVIMNKAIQNAGQCYFCILCIRFIVIWKHVVCNSSYSLKHLTKLQRFYSSIQKVKDAEM